MLVTGLVIAGTSFLVGRLLGHKPEPSKKPQEPSSFDKFKSTLGAIADLTTVIGLFYAGLGYVWTKFSDKILAAFSWILTAFDWILVVFMAALDIRALNDGGDRRLFGRGLGTVACFIGAVYLACSLETAPGFSSRLSALGSAAGVGADSSLGALLVGVMVGLGGMLGDILIGWGEHEDYSDRARTRAANVLAAVALCYVAVRFVIQRFL